jgi:hypothetical protein
MNRRTLPEPFTSLPQGLSTTERPESGKVTWKLSNAFHEVSANAVSKVKVVSSCAYRPLARIMIYVDQYNTKKW